MCIIFRSKPYDSKRKGRISKENKNKKYLDLNYIKIQVLPNTQTQMQIPAAATTTVEPKPEQLKAYQKQLLRNND